MAVLIKVTRNHLWSAPNYFRYCWMRVVRRPPRTAAITSALRRMTQRFVPGAGKSAIVKGLPSGPITHFGLGRMGNVIKTLTPTTELHFECSIIKNGDNLPEVIELINRLDR